MSLSDSSPDVPKWVILWRERLGAEWKVHSHHKGITLLYGSIDSTVEQVKTMRRRGLQAMAVREDHVSEYGVRLWQSF